MIRPTRDAEQRLADQRAGYEERLTDERNRRTSEVEQLRAQLAASAQAAESQPHRPQEQK